MMNASCLATNRLPAILILLGMVLLLAACGSSSRSMMEPGPMDGDGGPTMDLGEWNTPMAGAREVSDTNQVLRAYYDESGVGHVVAAAPVQPQGTGTAVWNGMWSGAIEVDPDPLVTEGLTLLGTTPEQLTGLQGAARVTAYFGGSGVMADLTYMDLGLDDFGITELKRIPFETQNFSKHRPISNLGHKPKAKLQGFCRAEAIQNQNSWFHLGSTLTSDRVAVSGGRFAPTKTESADASIDFQGAPLTVTVTGAFAGEGAFGGTDAAGVVGYVDGDLTVAYGGQDTRNLGTFQSVFYGTSEGN